MYLSALFADLDLFNLLGRGYYIFSIACSTGWEHVQSEFQARCSPGCQGVNVVIIRTHIGTDRVQVCQTYFIVQSLVKPSIDLNYPFDEGTA